MDEKTKAFLRQQIQQRYLQPQQEAKQGFKLTDLLPVAGGIVGGIGGSFLAPGVGTVAGGAGGSALGESLRQKIEGEETDLGKIGTEGLFGAIPGGIGKAGKVGKIAAGKALKGAGEKYAVKGLKLTPSQLFKFKEQYGSDVLSVLKKHNLIGADSEEILKRGVMPLQKSFDDIARKSGLKVQRGAVEEAFDKRVKDLLESADPDDLSLAKKVMELKGSIVKKHFKKGAAADVSAITKERQLFDSKVKNFAIDPTKAGEKRLVADALRESIQMSADKAGLKGASGMSLKEIGSELSKLMKIEGDAARQANLGRGSNPLSISSLVGAGLGGTVGGIPGAAVGGGGCSSSKQS